MTAQDRFKKGDKVKLTADGVKQKVVRGPHKFEGVTGRVIGFSPRQNDLVRVIRDDCKTPVSYHMKFWERV